MFIKPPPSYLNPDPHAVAIVGMSISAPGSEARGLDTKAFYTFLEQRGSAIIRVPADRWNADAYHGTAPGQMNTTKGGFIPKLAYGDPQEFGISPKESSQMKADQTILLHQAFAALQRSGVDFRGTPTGVFVGCNAGQLPYEVDITQTDSYYSTGTLFSITANRISYVFDLLGPSVPVDTACSSSLTAMHLAVQAIRNGECHQAVVAGMNFITSPFDSVSLSKLGILSPDGISKAFDEAADGFGRADTAGAVIIKRHDLAVTDNNNILASLVGTSITTCGSIMGSMSTPSPDGQARAIQNAYSDAGLKPYHADFVELHGTGTIVGDAVEANTAGAVFSEGRNGREIIIGSVKSNTGHGENGAYMTALVKVVMMLQERKILPNGYFKTPSRKIDFSRFNLRVPVEVEDMIAQDSRRGLIASISSYGIGGLCGHTVLREHDRRPVRPPAEALKLGPFLFAVGALTPKSCIALVENYKRKLKDNDPLAVAEHMGTRARQMPWRTYAISPSLASATFSEPVLIDKRPNPLIYCFSGQGPQHWQQGRVLMATFPVFRESVYACDKIHEEYTGTSFLSDTGLFVDSVLKDNPLETTHQWPASIISVSITYFQIALFDLLTSLGLRADAIVGHSIGEIAAMYASGAVPRDMAIKIAVARGHALSFVDNVGGTMVAVSGCDADTVCDYIEAASALAGPERNGAKLFIAAFNSPADIGVSGSEESIELLSSYINTWVEGASAHKLMVSTAVHSPYVDPCEARYRTELHTIFTQHSGPFRPIIPTISTVTAEFISDEYDVDYLWRNLRQPVLFSTAIPKMIQRFGQNSTFVEVSPHPVLSQYIKQMGAYDSLAASKRLPSACQVEAGAKLVTEIDSLLEVLGKLLTFGINSINFASLTGCPVTAIEEIQYPFREEVLPVAKKEPTYLRRLLPPTKILNSPRLRLGPSLPEVWLGEHIVNGSNLLPVAVYVEMALEFQGVTQIFDCSFEAVCVLDESDPPITLEVAKEGNSWSVKSSSALTEVTEDLDWARNGPMFDKLHAWGKLGFGAPDIGSESVTKVDVDSVLARCISTHGKDEYYTTIKTFVQFGPQFLRIEKASLNETEIICWTRGHVDGLNSTDYVFHPVLIDAVFQSCLGWIMLYDRMHTDETDLSIAVFPHSLRHAYRNDGSLDPIVLPAEFRTYARLVEWSPQHQVIDAYVLKDDNTVLFTFEGFRTIALPRARETITKRFTTIWQPRALPATTYINKSCLLGDVNTRDEALLLQMLDHLAIEYTKETLKTIPEGFVSDMYDRRRFLAWARKTVAKFEHSTAPSIPASLEHKYGAVFEATRRIGQSQKDIFKTSTTAVDVLFRDNIMSQVYELFPFVGEVFDSVVARVVDLVKEAISAGKRVVRILEVGAGTGRLTALLGEALVHANLTLCYVDYVTTDVSISLAQEATLKSPWPTMTPMTFDLSVDITHQSLDASSFDIIVAFDVLHAVPSIKGTMDTLQRLLLPGGYIAIIDVDGTLWAEGRDGALWCDFFFGSFKEWMGVLEHRPGATHCTLTPDEWKDALESSGFSIPVLLTSGAGFHFAFIAQGGLVPPRGSSTLSTPTLVSSAAPVNLGASFDTSAMTLLNSAAPDLAKADRGSIRSKDDLTVIRGYQSNGEIELVNFVSELNSSKSHVLWLYTDTDYRNAKLVGIVRSIRNEYPLWKIMLVLFDPSWCTPQREAYIMEQLVPLEYVDADILVDRNGSTHVSRVIASLAPPQTERRGTSLIQFDNAAIWKTVPLSLGPDQVEVTVEFVNLSPVWPGYFEFSGLITALGPDLSNSNLAGQSVCGIVAHQPGSIAICRKSDIAPFPSDVGPATAAAVVGRLTFIRAVVKRALQSVSTSSPRVLLHAAGLSSAARVTYKYLCELGLDVMATLDESLAINNYGHKVYSSTRWDIWVPHTQRWAKHGVDVIFNFDSDNIVWNESIPLLAKNGTMVQIGGSNLSRQTRSGHQYLCIDYDALLAQEGVASVFLSMPHDVKSAMPLMTVIDIGQLKNAREKAQSLFTDSAVLLDIRAIDENLPVYRAGILEGSPMFNPRVTYAIVGGVGGFGVTLAQCIVERGARHIVLTSRSGEGALGPGRLVREKRILNSLRSQPGVTIDIVALDCLDVEGTRFLFAQTTPRISGVFYLPLILDDQPFVKLTTEEHWKSSIADTRTRGLQVLLQAVDPTALEFLVLTSTLGTIIGSDGQANYVAASAEMEALGFQLPNTVSVIVPPITDTAPFVRALLAGAKGAAAISKHQGLGKTAMHVAEHCIDAIFSLNTPAETSLHIPDVNWNVAVERVPVYAASAIRHLLIKGIRQTKALQSSNNQTIRGVCASVLALRPEAVEENVPFATYGLDSLTSVRLSSILKKIFGLEIGQLQLLSNHITLERLQNMHAEQRILAKQNISMEYESPGHAKTDYNTELVTSIKHFTVVRLNNVTSGTPLFIIHGGGGGVNVFRKLGPNIKFPTYGVQDTPDAPITGTLGRLARFYLSQIKEVQPHGPYRLCGYSLGSCIALYISNLIHSEGEKVDSLIMLDASPAHILLPLSQQRSRKSLMDGRLQNDIMDIVIDIRDSQTVDHADSMVDQFREHFEKIAIGESGAKWVSRFCKSFAAHVMMSIRAYHDLCEQVDGQWPAEHTLVVRASKGKIARLEAVCGKVDLSCIPGVDVRDIPGTHAGILNPVNGLPAILNEVLKS